MQLALELGNECIARRSVFIGSRVAGAFDSNTEPSYRTESSEMSLNQM